HCVYAFTPVTRSFEAVALLFRLGFHTPRAPGCLGGREPTAWESRLLTCGC
ncbi:hypothetical protein B0H10DRAFT_2080707, partial [Mycena sp. CBHHK59/15]